MNEEELIRRAMRALGRRTSEAKRAAVRRNGAATRFVARPLTELCCNCGANADDAHKTSCPRGRAWRRRQKTEGTHDSTSRKLKALDTLMMADADAVADDSRESLYAGRGL